MADALDSKRALARDIRTSGKTLARLAGHREWSVRADVAANPQAPSKALAKLAEDKRWGGIGFPGAVQLELQRLVALLNGSAVAR